MSLTDLEHGVDAAVEGVHEEHGDEEREYEAHGVEARQRAQVREEAVGAQHRSQAHHRQCLGTQPTK